VGKAEEAGAEAKTEVKERIKATLREDRVTVLPPEDVEGLSTRGYGVSEGDGVALTLYEALYLVGNGDLEVVDGATGEAMGFQDLLRRFRSVDGDAWVRYLIYRDLRKRGYVVREGFGLGIDFRVYDRGGYGEETAKYLILGVREGRPVSVDELVRALRHAMSLKKGLVLAVLDRRGEIVHYSLSEFAPG